jgi:hypothetical protein
MKAVQNLPFSRLITLAVVIGSGNLWSLGASIDMPGKTAEQATEIAQKALKRLDTTCAEKDETMGAHWRCKTPFYSIVSLDVFVSTIPDKAIVRADSRGRQGYAFIDLVAQEAGQGPFENKYTEKSMLLTVGATLVSPAFGYWYINSGSMIKSKSIFLPFVGMLFGDLALFWVSSKTFFTNGFDPFGDGLAPMLVSMGAYRAVMLVPFSMQILAHNRFAGLQITYRY